MISRKLSLARIAALSMDGFRALSSSRLNGMICDIVKH